MLTPRENLKLYGHAQGRETFLKAYHSQRFPHAWIVAGPFGIGKATFAYHMVRYVLSGRQDLNTEFQNTDPLYRRTVAQSHGDLYALGGEGTEVGVEAIRDLNSALNQTSSEGGWRVVIIDGADTLNRNAANALLKRLEEPPPKTLFFLTTPLPGRLLPTIRSRCQLLTLSPLGEDDLREVLRSQNLSPPDFLSMGQGSPGRLVRLMEGEGASLYAEFQKVIVGASPSSLIHTYGGDEGTYAILEDLLRNFLHTHLLAKVEGHPSFFEDSSLDQALEVCEKSESLFDQCRFAQLDQKATLTCVFANLVNRKHL